MTERHDRKESLEVAEALWELGSVRADELPRIAINALEDGFDSPSLRILAGLELAESDQATALFVKALGELGLGRPSKQDAAIYFARAVASEMLLGRISLIDGAVAISKAALLVEDPRFHDLDTFSYAASEYEERPEDRQFFEDAIRAEALRLIEESSRVQ